MTTNTSPSAPDSPAVAIGQSIRARREELRLTQAQLADLAGIPAAQSVSEIEKGRRDVKAHELVRISRALHTEVDVLLGLAFAPAETRVLWRRGTKAEDRMREVQLLERARRYSQLEEWCGEPAAQALPNLQFEPATATRASVAELADSMRRLFDLGSIPAATLQRTLEDSYGVKIFTESLEGDQAAACVRSHFGAAVLLNGADVPWRRNFSLAHELFHLVTWDAVESAWNRGSLDESSEPVWYDRLERLANHFASRLLLPTESVVARVNAHITDGKLTYARLAAVACDFEVSAQALLFRLCDLRILDRDTVDAVLKNEAFILVTREAMRPLKRKRVRSWYPDRYLKLAARAYQSGTVGKAIVAKYLEMPYAEVEAFNLGEPHGSEAALSIG